MLLSHNLTTCAAMLGMRQKTGAEAGEPRVIAGIARSRGGAASHRAQTMCRGYVAGGFEQPCRVRMIAVMVGDDEIDRALVVDLVELVAAVAHWHVPSLGGRPIPTCAQARRFFACSRGCAGRRMSIPSRSTGRGHERRGRLGLPVPVGSARPLASGSRYEFNPIICAPAGGRLRRQRDQS